MPTISAITPIAIPALAPVLRPLPDGDEFGVGVGVGVSAGRTGFDGLSGKFRL